MAGQDSVSKILDIMNTKQRWHIVRCLLAGHTRFNQIKRECNMSSAALSRTLKYLEYKGLVTRLKNGGDASEYSLTRNGYEFHEVISALARLGKRI